MNWLAHLYLSKPNSAFRVGNLLPDLASKAHLANLSMEFQAGIDCHRRIDLFTDSHPVVRRSIGRFPPPYRRFGGILTDIFYDHFLACEWDAYSKIALQNFVAEVYTDFERHRAELPTEINERLDQIKNANWIGSYAEIGGIAEALRRLGLRLRRPSDLAGAISILERDYELFQEDFRMFFPELVAHVSKDCPNRIH